MNRFYKWFFLFFISYITVQVIRKIVGGIGLAEVFLIIIISIIWLILCIFIFRSSSEYRKKKES